MSLDIDLVAYYRCYDTTDDQRPAGSATLHNNLVISQVGTDAKCGSYLDATGIRGATFEIAPVDYSLGMTLPAAFTFSAWVKNPHTGANNTYILNGPNHSPMVTDQSGDVFFLQDCFSPPPNEQAHAAGFNIRNETTPNQWHRLTIMINASGAGQDGYPNGFWAKYYIDGNEVGHVELSTGGGSCVPLSSFAQYINSGDPASFNYNAFDQMTDIAIWHRLLIFDEIQELSNGCLYNILNPSSANLSDTSGFASEQASFSLTTSNANQYWWSWVSTPSGSSVGNEAIELPHGTGVHSNFDMTDAEIHIRMDMANEIAPGKLIDWTGYPPDRLDPWDTSRFGTINGATQVAGKVGDHAYEFDGTNTITFGENLLYTTEDFTFALWIKPAAVQPNDWCSIFSAHKTGPGTGYYLIQNGSNDNEYTFVGNPNGSYHPWSYSINLVPDVWSHVVVTRVGENIKMYVNGILTYDDPDDCAATIEYGTAGNPLFTLGGYDGNGAWVGSIDYFVSWSRALSYDEVRDLYFMQSGDGTIANGNVVFGQNNFSFTPDVEGDYVMSIDIGGGVEETATATIDAFPSAGIIPDVTGYTGVGKHFIAYNAINPQYYTWQFQSVPAGSSVSTSPVSDNESFMFTPDVEGTYTVQLEVYPGATETANAVIELAPEAIVSNAAVDGFVNESITFDGSTSVNPQYYTWTWQSVPAGSSIAGSFTGSDTFTFTPDVEGTYIIELKVDASVRGITTATADIELRPEAVLSNLFGTVGRTFIFNGSNSVNASYYTWTWLNAPSGSSISGVSSGSDNLSFVPDIAGLYTIRLEIDTDVFVDATAQAFPPPPPLLSDKYEFRFAHAASNQREKRVAQVPFSLNSRLAMSIRKSSDSDFEDS